LEAVMTTLRSALVFGLTLAMLAAVGCENTDPSPDERALIEQAVGGYLNALAEAYSTLDTSALEGHASPNEIAAVRKLLKELLQNTGDRIDAQLTGFDIETISVFRGINASVRLIEVWDITRYGAADGIEKGRFESTVQRTLLQLRLIDGHWLVVGRSNLEQFTPVPETQPTAVENPV
jgi:hypothetical protein